ncbi:MAG: WXG100 family type VII secretion target [Anaerolineae bacterium]|nr:WXG100 family type VII secretion target [Anaerolineae bacterium]
MVDIRVSPERLREVAGTLDAQRQEIVSALSQTVTTVQNLQGEWSGMAQVDYTQIFDNEVPPMRDRVAEILENLANEMRRIAQVFEETDQGVV